MGIPTPALLRQQQWMLGPSAGGVDGEIATMLRGLAIPESQQRIFQSDAAALEEVQRVGGITLTIGFAVAKDLAAGRLTHVQRSGAGPVGRVVRGDIGTVGPSTRRVGARPLHHHSAMHAGDDPRIRRGRDPVPPEGPRDAVELNGFELICHSGTRFRTGIHECESSASRRYQAWVMSACCRIQACIAMPAATPALMLRVEPNWAIDTVIAAPARMSSVMPGPS